MCFFRFLESEAIVPLYPKQHLGQARSTRNSLLMEAFEMGKRLLSLSVAKPT